MGKIRVVHVYKSFNVYNGLIEILNILAHNMDHTKYELGVCVYEYNNNDFGKKFQELGGKIYNLNIPSRAYNKHEEFLSLYRFFKEEKPDIVQTHVLKANLYGTLAARLAKVPVVIATEMTLKDIASSKVSRFRDRLIQPLVSAIVNKCDRFVVTSEFIQKEWSGSIKKNRFEVVYPPFNLEKYDQAIRKPQSSFRAIGKRVGFVGRLSEEKSVSTLLNAIGIVKRIYPDMELKIVGTGPMESLLKKQCVDMRIANNVKFEGYKENSFESLKEMDIFVLPSRTEGCPIVILEAMAMGLPVIATNVGGNPELVINNETGFLIPHDDAEVMAEKILLLIADKDYARQLGQNGRRRAFAEFHPSSFTHKLQNLYSQIYGEKLSVKQINSPVSGGG